VKPEGETFKGGTWCEGDRAMPISLNRVQLEAIRITRRGGGKGSCPGGKELKSKERVLISG